MNHYVVRIRSKLSSTFNPEFGEADLGCLKKKKKKQPGMRVFFFLFFLGLHLKHMEVPRLGVE